MPTDMVMALLLAAASLGAGSPNPPAPPPDPYPGTPKGTPITWVGYSYRLPAIDGKTGRPVAGFFFQCHVTKRGRTTCVLHHR